MFQTNSIDNSLVVTAKIRTGRLFDLVSAYTFSHSIDNGGAYAGSTFDTGRAANRFQTNLERGNSANDQRHRLLNYFVLNLPFGRGMPYLRSAHGVLQQVVGGCQLAGINSINTGQPFTVWASRSIDFSGFNTARQTGPISSEAARCN
jgi:hypothetical protein